MLITRSVDGWEGGTIGRVVEGGTKNKYGKKQIRVNVNGAKVGSGGLGRKVCRKNVIHSRRKLPTYAIIIPYSIRSDTRLGKEEITREARKIQIIKKPIAESPPFPPFPILLRSMLFRPRSA